MEFPDPVLNPLLYMSLMTLRCTESDPELYACASNCLLNISIWMWNRYLKVNISKAELLFYNQQNISFLSKWQLYSFGCWNQNPGIILAFLSYPISNPSTYCLGSTLKIYPESDYFSPPLICFKLRKKKKKSPNSSFQICGSKCTRLT